MKPSQIIFSTYSPLMAVDTELVGSDGKTVATPRVCSLCRCGESSMKPMCDGTHAQIGFVGEREDANKPELEYYLG
jgi:CDGSH-type Zn-finger protein